MVDFLVFRRMIATVAIQVVFWLGVLFIFGFAFSASDNSGIALILSVVLSFYWRIFCEFLIVVFRINDTLTIVKNNTLSLRSLQFGDGSQADIEPRRLWPTSSGTGAARPATRLAEGDAFAMSTEPGDTGSPSAAASADESTAGAGTESAPGTAPTSGGAPAETTHVRAEVICSRCGTTNPAQNRFCESCGGELQT